MAEETVYTPFQFFDLPDYLQRRILIEDLNLQSIENLCEAADKYTELKAKVFKRNLCENDGMWREKILHNFGENWVDYYIENYAYSNLSGIRRTNMRRSALYPEDGTEKEKYVYIYKRLPNDAAKLGDIETIQRLERLGIDIINHRNESGYTPLMSALSANDFTVSLYLFENGSRLNREDTFEIPGRLLGRYEALKRGSYIYW